jgi:hypothetical protein
MENNQLKFEFFQEAECRYDFEGGELSSDGGLMLIREFDEKFGFTKKISGCIADWRHPIFRQYEIIDLLRERVYFLASGYEDCNDEKYLRADPVFQAALRNPNKLWKDSIMASQPSLSRFENHMKWRDMKIIIEKQIEIWLDSLGKNPSTIILDADTTDDPCHGNQQLSLFHGYYGQYIYYPLIISCNGMIVLGLLRPGLYHSNKMTRFVLSYLIKKIRSRFGNIQIQLRADSGFATPRIYEFLEQNNIQYAIGLITNKTLLKKNAELAQQAKNNYESTGEKQRYFQAFEYQADSWTKFRTVIAKAEYMENGANNRFIVTNIESSSEIIFNVYDDFYIGRGESENWIKELKNAFFADRLSCHKFNANQFRLILSILAHQLLFYMRQNCLKDTLLETVSTDTLRLKLFKIAVQIKRSVRRLWFHFCSAYPYQNLFQKIHQNILAFQT